MFEALNDVMYLSKTVAENWAEFFIRVQAVMDYNHKNYGSEIHLGAFFLAALFNVLL